MKSKLAKVLFWFGTIGVLVTSACKKDPQASVQPILPPVESMQMLDLSSMGADIQKSTYLNIRYAKAVLAVWHNALTVDFAWQLAAFKLASSQKVVRVEDNKWTWTYTVQVGALQSDIVLTAWFVGQVIHWEMTVNNEKRLEGTSTSGQANGTWMFYKNSATAYMSVVWAYNASDKTGKVTYKKIDPSDVDSDSYLIMTITNQTTDSDVTFKCYHKSISSSIDIQWSRKTKAGSYRVNDGAWKFWDNLYKDN